MENLLRWIYRHPGASVGILLGLIFGFLGWRDALALIGYVVVFGIVGLALDQYYRKGRGLW